MKDIEDAAHAVSSGTVGQRDAIAMAAGGHPQLVEAVSASCSYMQAVTKFGQNLICFEFMLRACSLQTLRALLVAFLCHIYSIWLCSVSLEAGRACSLCGELI